ncbi:MAG: DUF2842 domain-containing protein [Ignavibacteriales bacterium]
MNLRPRNLLGGIAIVAFLAAYVSIALIVADHLPDNPAARLAFYAIVGIAWGVPIIPLVGWMAKER